MTFRPSPTPWTLIHPGCTVLMHSLESEAGKAVNGKTGVVSGFDQGTGRWAVTIEGQTKKYRPTNMTFRVSAGGHDKISFIMLTPGFPGWLESDKNTCTPGFMLGSGGPLTHGEPAICVSVDPAEFRESAALRAKLSSAMESLAMPRGAVDSLMNALTTQVAALVVPNQAAACA